jgi:hypothetical protein
MTVAAGAASFLIASTPIWTSLLAGLFLGERLNAVGWSGTLVSFVGIAVIANERGHGLRFSPGALMILGGGISYGVYMVLQKRVLRRYRSSGVHVLLVLRREFAADSVRARSHGHPPRGSGERDVGSDFSRGLSRCDCERGVGLCHVAPSGIALEQLPLPDAVGYRGDCLALAGRSTHVPHVGRRRAGSGGREPGEFAGPCFAQFGRHGAGCGRIVCRRPVAFPLEPTERVPVPVVTSAPKDRR